MSTRMAGRRTGALVLLLMIAGAARAQSVGALGGGGLEAPWQGAVEPLQGQGGLAINAGIAYVDNAALATTNKKSDEVTTVGMTVDYSHAGRELSVTSFGTLDGVFFLQNSFSPEPYGNLSTNASWGKPSDPFQWTLQDTFGEGQESPLEAPTLANQEYINYLSTGPTVNFNFSTRTRFDIRGLYQNTTYQHSLFSSESYDGGAGFTYAMSAISSLSLTADALRTRFGQEGIAPTYDTRVASLTYRAKFLRTSITASAGYTQINYTNSWSGAPTVSLDLTRELGPFTSIFVSGRTSYNTLGESMTENLGIPTGSAVVAGMLPYTSSPAPFKETLGSAGWNFDRLRTSLALAASVGDLRYDETPTAFSGIQPTVAAETSVDSMVDFEPDMARLIRPFGAPKLAQTNDIDSTFETYSASITRKLRPTLSVSLRGYLTDSRYGNLGASSIYESYSLLVTKQFGRTAITAYGEWLHQNTSGVDTGLGLARYDAAAMGLTVTYNLIAGKP